MTYGIIKKKGVNKMTVKELTRDQLNELRWTMWFNDCEKEKETGVYRFYDIRDITDRVIYKEYEGIDFVEEDFFCTMDR